VTPTPNTKQASVTRFRAKLLVAMMLMVCAITTLALYLAHQNIALNVERDLQREFQDKLAALHNVQEIRHAALVERCRALVRKPRIHAALEDNALDLLYPSAKDELRDVMEHEDDQSPDQVQHALHAKFYRFLDGKGEVIPSPNIADVGVLKPAEEIQLSLHHTPKEPQIGYLIRQATDQSEAISEIIAMPIISSETGEGAGAPTGGGSDAGIGAPGQPSLASNPSPAQIAEGYATLASMAPAPATLGIGSDVGTSPNQPSLSTQDNINNANVALAAQNNTPNLAPSAPVSMGFQGFSPSPPAETQAPAIASTLTAPQAAPALAAPSLGVPAATPAATPAASPVGPSNPPAGGQEFANLLAAYPGLQQLLAQLSASGYQA